MNDRAFIRGILGCAMLAGALGMWRQAQTLTVLEPVEVKFEAINALDYASSTGVFQVLAEDPFGHLELPRHTIPLQELRLEFAGPYHPGGWYVYPCPASRHPAIINQDWVVTAVPETQGNDHALVWTLEDSQLARIDFPDDLSVPLTLQRIVLRSGYASIRSPVYVGMLVAWAATVLLLLARVFVGNWHRPATQLTAMALLAGLKILLAHNLGQSFMPVMGHDDGLFLRQAESILAGNWLGPFDELTLSKGPSFSLFLAASAASGLPLQFNELWLHALACGAFVFALAPWLRSAGWRLALFAVLLFDPHSMSAELIGRVLRSGIHPALTLFTFAGLLGLVTRSSGQLRALWLWALLAGAAGVIFWYSREEGIWMLPSAALLLGTAVVHGWGAQISRRGRWLALVLGVPVLVFAGGKASLRAINQAHYGVTIGVDVLEGSFPAAYGAITRVTNPDPIPGVPTTRATREHIYAVSPAFARLATRLEGSMQANWAGYGWQYYPHERAGEEIRNGWFTWALREAAAHEGVYADAATAESYWQTVADEINAAVASGSLAGSGPRNGFFPVWHESYTSATLRNWFRAVDLLARSSDFKAQGVISQGAPEEIARLAERFHARAVTAEEPGGTDARLRLLLHQIYAWLGWPLTVLALGATALLVWRSRRPDAAARLALAVLLSLWGGVASLCLVVALVEATAFPAIIGAYLGPAAPLLMSCWVLAPALAWDKRNQASQT